ncbi:MAG: YegS/Rv2252/BmrU family lipid kinase, partial [Clostridia bacterium]|nr:YegS/Rv2252/BmrU family lipid kinase [Clostridia bacterium]
TVHPTQHKLDGFEYIKNHIKEYDLISVCGGDGMLNESVNALMTVKKEKRPSMLFLPGGSTNDFASTLKIPINIKRASEKITDGKPFLCDLGRFNNQNFVYVAAFGALTSVSYDTPQDMKNKFGHLAYVVSGIKELASIKSYRVRVKYEDKTIEDDFIYGMVSNSNQIGGFKTSKNPEFSINDGEFEVVLIRNPKNALGYQIVLSDLITQNYISEYFITFKTSKVTFESDEMISWTLDGEFGGNVNKAVVNIIEKAFSIIL